MNDKSTPNQMRILIKRMLGKETPIVETDNKPKKELTVRDTIKIMRTLNEDVEEKTTNKKTVYDQGLEEEKIMNFFRDMNVSIKFIDLEVYDNLVFWGGTVDGIIQFIYKVTPEESTSGVEFNYLEDFTPDNPENEEIIEKIDIYYDTFYKYWRNNIIQK